MHETRGFLGSRTWQTWLQSVHGRTRADFYQGAAEYDTIREIKSAVTLPVFANGDIGCAHKAREVLDFTGADGVMIGRAAQGAPWVFGPVNAYLSAAAAPPPRGGVRVAVDVDPQSFM